MMDALEKDLQALRLKGMADNLRFRVEQAATHKIGRMDFLATLVEDELARRGRKDYQKRFAASDLKGHKTLETYDFLLQPAIGKEMIDRLATCEFIKNKDKLLLMGVSGVGKSHLCNGIGIRALEKGYTVYRYNSHDLVDSIFVHKKAGTYKIFLKKILGADLVILDEFAIRQYPEGGTDELFAILEKLDERVSIALTTNRDFRDWQAFFPDSTIASAFTDRMINNAIMIKVEKGISERQKNFERKNKPDGFTN